MRKRGQGRRWSALVTVLALVLGVAGCDGGSEAIEASADPPQPAGAGPETAEPEAAEDEAAGFSEADFAAHVAKLGDRLPEGFTVVVEPPFVVIGDEAAGVVKRRAERTVRWTVRLLKKDYFEKDPDEILDIWLFRDKESYRKHTKELFGIEPHTPFGFCSRDNHALIMNVATGGGTLVHEIVHPFMRSNFPECPAWFNEGLASLYEQCRERDGHITGMTNWRLAGLQKAIRGKKTFSFERLTGLTDAEFYGRGSGLHYAQARYLCYYLQEEGLLRELYRRFRANCSEDPTGYEALRGVLKTDDMEAFRQQWEKLVLGLRFPEE